jgi:IS5 family transposase
MRIKIDSKPMFPLTNIESDLKIVTDYQSRYLRISDLLDTNPAILNALHMDLEKWGSADGRESTFSSEQVLRFLIVKCLEGLSFRDTIVRIFDSDFLRNFTRSFSGKVMNFTVLDTAFKLVRPQTWEKINDILSSFARKEKKITGSKLRVDSTVCESNIHYPTDASLLWDSYRCLSRLVTSIGDEDSTLDMGYRFHDSKVKQFFTFIATHCSKKNKSTIRKVHTKMGILIERVGATVEKARAIIEIGTGVNMSVLISAQMIELQRVVGLAQRVIDQSKRAHAGETVPAAERIFSIFETHTELLIRGKARKPVEFGHMVTIAQTEEKYISYYCVEEKSRHDRVIGDEVIKDHVKKFGKYPKGFAADKNYYGGPDHTKKWEEKIETYSVGKKGRRTEVEEQREHGRLFKLLQAFRAGCEGSISALKRAFGMSRCLNRGFTSFASSIGCIVFCHNLVVLSKL